MDPEAPQPNEAGNMDVAVAIVPTAALLALSVALFGSDSSSGANQIALVIGAAIATIIGVKNGHSWKVIEQNIVGGISAAMPAIMILFSVGSLIGVWMLSGTVPTMIYYGLLLLDPAVFYAASCLLCAITALSIGSSWTVAGTLGIGLMGVAAGLELSLPITAGAIISGAYFGDKLSPLSDTTNLAPAVTEIDIFTHIRHMAWTTLPSFAIALAVFIAIGLSESAPQAEASPRATLNALDGSFAISPLMLLPVVLVVYLAARKTPAVASILAGVFLGIVVALIYQRPAIARFVDDPSLGVTIATLKAIWIVLFDGYSGTTGDANLDALLSRGGMSSMLNTVWLILAAMTFGAAMEQAGILRRLISALASAARSTGNLIATTLATCLGVNVLAADQYMSIVVTGRMFRQEYRRRGLHEKNLARALEDGGTITSPLIPWNTCGAYMAATLGVPTLAYLPFCFFNLVNPFVSAAYGYTGFKIEPLDVERERERGVSGVR